jgi:hypothetical protein
VHLVGFYSLLSSLMHGTMNLKRILVFSFHIILLYSVIIDILVTNSTRFCVPCNPFFGSDVLVALSVKKEHGFVAMI